MLPMSWNFVSDEPDESVAVTLANLGQRRATNAKLPVEFGELRDNYAKPAAPASKIPA
ncbi:MAG: hypothetical protein ABI728_15030 [Betaproteobacteria bacterium]